MNDATNTQNHPKLQRFLDKFTEISVKVGNQVHLRSLRDAFATLMPMFILAGVAVLFNNVIFTWLFKGATLARLQVFGTALTNGTLNIASILIAPMIAYFLAKNKSFNNPISASAIAISAVFIMLAINVSVVPNGAKAAVSVTGAVLYSQVGTTGMFAGIIIGLIATEIYMKLSSVKALKINLGDQVPPAVGQSFSVLLPSLLTLGLFGIIAAIFAYFNTDLVTLISRLIQEPLRQVNTSLPGFLLIYSTGNFLYTLGIHQTVINGSLLDPLNLVNMNENMAAVAAGKQPTHIINTDFVTVYSQMGGTGLTIALIIAVLLVSHYQPYKDVVKLASVPGIFEINEPIIFGFPIVFNIPMIIPFVLSPVIGSLIGYFATVIGFVKPLSVLVPWTTPPILSAIIASAGDWKVVLVQIIILAVCTIFYIPFIKISERVALKQAEVAQG
ncbi:PTS transporter subunit EIIC [Lactobacillus sp. ESL0731]|uniref:PTS sugar transporter subunit IIC n=1 Tax=unclassified Lactobacillus TaxID=2620435 RepID=UPI0023F87702|nr:MULTISPECIES: PTS transporter subunit EIIC [unclassified Lactobacillus]WEV51548.1 PTS transporter subunit EIIC [Lactobacillus sp. ESL0700]WEV62676.1 PTS transporter subunit EIIC [Lactobacillus sp. ESL0731]